MISRTRYGRAVLLMLAAGVSVAAMPPAGAQTPPSDQNPDVTAAEAGAAPEANSADTADLELDWSQLNVDASTLPVGPAWKVRIAPGPGAEMSWSSKDKPDGSAALSVKQPLSPFWDARIGADMTVVNQPTILTTSDLLRQKFSSDGQPSQSSGTAWAALTAPASARYGIKRRSKRGSTPGKNRASSALP